MTKCNMNVLRFENLTANQIDALCKDNRVILLSFGSIEQHSAHLPVGTDCLCMIKRVEEIARHTNSIVFSPLQLGYSFNHAGMPGTISLSAEIFIDIVANILRQLFQQGWKRAVIFSGHNGNWPALRVAVQIAREAYIDAQVVLADGYPRMSDEHRKNRFVRNFDYHAGLTETALVSYFAKDLLDTESIPPANQDMPDAIKKLMNKKDLDEIDTVLMNAITPQHTQALSTNGIWGANDPSLFEQIPVRSAMESYVDFYVQLIKRWDALEL